MLLSPAYVLKISADRDDATRSSRPSFGPVGCNYSGFNRRIGSCRSWESLLANQNIRNEGVVVTRNMLRWLSQRILVSFNMQMSCF